MKNLQTLAKECEALLDKLGINYAKGCRYVVNTRAKNRWGQCTIRAHSLSPIISVNAKLLTDNNVPEDSVREVIIHELLHTVPGCACHTGSWKQLANKITKNTKYTIKRTSGWKELGFQEDTRKFPYQVECSKCHHIFKRQKRSPLIDHPERYIHKNCGGKLQQITN